MTENYEILEKALKSYRSLDELEFVKNEIISSKWDLTNIEMVNLIKIIEKLKEDQKEVFSEDEMFNYLQELESSSSLESTKNLNVLFKTKIYYLYYISILDGRKYTKNFPSKTLKRYNIEVSTLEYSIALTTARKLSYLLLTEIRKKCPEHYEYFREILSIAATD